MRHLGPMVARTDLGKRDKAEGVISVARLLPERAVPLPQDLQFLKRNCFRPGPGYVTVWRPYTTHAWDQGKTGGCSGLTSKKFHSSIHKMPLHYVQPVMNGWSNPPRRPYHLITSHFVYEVGARSFWNRAIKKFWPYLG
jgi:hypothetical protein